MNIPGNIILWFLSLVPMQAVVQMILCHIEYLYYKLILPSGFQQARVWVEQRLECEAGNEVMMVQRHTFHNRVFFKTLVGSYMDRVGRSFIPTLFQKQCVGGYRLPYASHLPEHSYFYRQLYLALSLQTLLEVCVIGRVVIIITLHGNERLVMQTLRQK